MYHGKTKEPHSSKSYDENNDASYKVFDAFFAHNPPVKRNKDTEGSFKNQVVKLSMKNKRFHDDNRERFDSRSPTGPDLREYLDTRKPKRWKSRKRNSGWPKKSEQRFGYQNASDDEEQRLQEKLLALTQKHIEYELKPESHPKYQDEWRSFWNRRCEELRRFGVNTEDYDFKPEWLEFWKRRLKEFYEEESADILRAIRQSKERAEEEEKGVRDDSSWTHSSENEEPDVRPPMRKSPIPEDMPPAAVRSRSPILPKSIGIAADINEDNFTISSALQTITNLEDGLSRIGPKVIDLVGKSLALIDGMDFDSFDRAKDMHSVKDKLNGQILHNKIQSVFKTFDNITSILRRMTESPNQSSKSTQDSKSFTDDPLGTLNSDVKQWMSIFSDVIENLEDKRSVDDRHFHSPQSSNAEHLTDAEVEALLQNFDTLSEKEKNHLILFLKSLEKTDEDRVKRLRYFFNGQVNRALGTVPDSTNDHRWRERSRERSRDRSHDRSFDRSLDRSGDRSRERTRDRSRERTRDRSLERSLDRSHDRSRDRSWSKPRKRPRTPSPIPEIFDNLHVLYQEQFKDPFYSDVIESLKQPHWRAPREVEQFIKQWKGLKIHPESGVLQLNMNGEDVYVIPDTIKMEVIEDFHRRVVRSGNLQCRSRNDTIGYVKRYCFMPNLSKMVHAVIDKCKHCGRRN